MKTQKVTTRPKALTMAVLFAGTLVAPQSASSGAVRLGERTLAPQEHDLSGSWRWEGTTESAIPPFIVEMIGQGIIPEGEITYLTCEDSGELELVQTGDTFDGTATQVLSCMTEGGQGPFSPPAFPPQFQVTNGVVSGKYTSFNFSTLVLATSQQRSSEAVTS